MKKRKRDDKHLLEMLRSPDPGISRAIELLIDQNEGMIRSLTKKYDLDDSCQSEILTDVFMALIKMVSKEGFELRAKLSTIIYTIMDCKCKDRLRSKQRQPHFTNLEELSNLYDPMDIIRELATKEELALVKTAMRRIGEKCQEILIGMMEFGYSPDELAKKLDLRNARVVISQKSRCLKRLRNLFRGSRTRDIIEKEPSHEK